MSTLNQQTQSTNPTNKQVYKKYLPKTKTKYKTKRKEERPFNKIEKYFYNEEPAFLLTYDQIIPFKVTKFSKYFLLSWRHQPKGFVSQEKLRVCISVPKKDWAIMKTKIKRNMEVEPLKLEPIHAVKERDSIKGYELGIVAKNKTNIRFVLRNALTITGKIIKFDKYVTLLQVDECTCLIYRHGIYQYFVKEDKSKTE